MRLLAAALSLTLAGSALAQAPSYSYVSLQYGKTDTDEAEIDGIDSVVLGASHDFGPFHVWGGVQNDEIGVAVGDLEQDGRAIGLGKHWTVRPNTRVHLRAAYVEARLRFFLDPVVVDPIVNKTSFHGELVEVGLRTHLTEKVEINAALSRVRAEGMDSTDSLVVAGEWRFNERWGVSLTSQLTESATGWLVGLRYHW